jgi:hypothetical protein
VTIQDHGGNFWRHGSPNADLESTWQQYFQKEIKAVADEREDQLRKAADPEDKSVEEDDLVPTECPVCGAIQFSFKNRRCYKCDTEIYKTGTRRVLMANGELKEQHALHDLRNLKRRKKDPSSEIAKAWKRAYFTALHSRNKMTFNQARAYLLSGNLRGCEHMAGQQLPTTLCYMPKHSSDWSRPVKDCGMDSLIKEQQ